MTTSEVAAPESGPVVPTPSAPLSAAQAASDRREDKARISRWLLSAPALVTITIFGILPLIIINGQEAIKAVPDSLRQAAFGVGATRWQTIWHHVLPNALPGILTGSILAVSRAIGETAPLIIVGASTFISIDPEGPFSKFTALPIQIYQWTTRAQTEFHSIAAAAIIVLLVLLLTLNATAVIIRNRVQRKY